MILCAGLSSAWQRVLFFDAFRLGAVNRAVRVHEGPGGKAVNAASAVHALGGKVRLLTFAGGERGEEFRRNLERTGLPLRVVPAAAPLRVCTTLVEAGRATELVENMEPARPEELRAFAEAFAEEAAPARAVVLGGSLPRGTPASFYRDLLGRTRSPVVLDARGPELLAALEARPFLVKPNRRELAETLGRDLSDDGALGAAMEELRERGASWVVVTDGAGPVRVRGEGGATVFLPPAVEVVNPVGSGDCLAGAAALGIALGRDPLEAVRYGIAAAADRLGRILPSGLDAARVSRLAERVRRA